jgi:hypothetical protein
MVIAHEVKKPVDYETANLFPKCIAIAECLPLCSGEIYDDIPQQDLALIRDLLHFGIERERKNIGRHVHASITVVELFHPPVVNKQNSEFGLLKVTRSEKFP